MNYKSQLKGESCNFKELLSKFWLDIIDPSILTRTETLLNEEIEEMAKLGKDFYPYHHEDIFRVFNLCPSKNISVVILGQDPYYGNRKQANGIAFSVNKGVDLPPSLKNIYKELRTYGTESCQDIDGTLHTMTGDLSEWVKMGIFLLNTSLTVRAQKPNSHHHIWAEFIEHIISIINESEELGRVLFVAWGNYAKNKYQTSTNLNLEKHKLICTSHPSPLGCYKTQRPFMGSGIFKKIEQWNDKIKLS